jgi:phosphomannomutase
MRSAAPSPRSPAEEGAKRIAVGRDGRDPFARARAALIRGLTEGGSTWSASAWARARCSTSPPRPRRRRRHPGHRKPQSGRLQRLQDAAPGRSVFGEEIQALGRRCARRALVRGQGQGRATSTSSTAMSTGWSRTSAAASSGSAGTPATAPRPGAREAGQALPGEHHTIFTDVDGRFPNHHPDPTVEKNLETSSAGRRQGPRLRHRLRRRRRPHRRGRRQGPGDLGRPAADDPRRPVLKEQPGATIIADVKASQTLFDRIAEMGGKP